MSGLALGLYCDPLHAAPSSGGDTVQRLYDALLSTMQNGRALGQSGPLRTGTTGVSQTALCW